MDFRFRGNDTRDRVFQLAHQGSPAEEPAFHPSHLVLHDDLELVVKVHDLLFQKASVPQSGWLFLKSKSSACLAHQARK